MNEAYLDNAATTRLNPEVAEAMAEVLRSSYGNPSSLHKRGVQANLLVEKARASVAVRMGAEPDEIIFTGGGTEANHLAIWGCAMAQDIDRREILISSIEHPSALHAASLLERQGFLVIPLPANPNGLVSVDSLRRHLGPRTALVSLMHANNEVGTIQEISEIAGMCEGLRVPLHCDATQTFGKLELDLRSWPGVTTLTVSAHKIHGPQGCGALFLRQGTAFIGLLGGGGQERGRRAGTENVTAIHGFGLAARLIDSNALNAIRPLRAKLVAGLLTLGAQINGSEAHALGTIVSATIPGVNSKKLLFELSRQNIYISAGSACASGKTTPSHVLTAMGLSAKQAQETIRISLGAQNTEAEIDRCIAAIGQLACTIRGVA